MAFAAAMGINFSAVIEMIGHDGSECVYKDKSFRRGFHIQECIDVANKLNFSCTPIEFRFALQPSPASTEIFEIPNTMARSLLYLIQTPRGVLECFRKTTQRGHAVAWISQMVYDPANGKTYSFGDLMSHGLVVNRLWRLQKNG